MCGRYTTPDKAAIDQNFHIDHHDWSGLIKRFNVGPTMSVPILYTPEGDAVVGTIARWGLIPSWWKKESLPTMTFNARSEEAATKPMWRHGMRTSRCLMPACGWYEWNENEKVTHDSGRKTNQPYFFYSPKDEVIAIAGLWSTWQAPNGDEVLSCALLTKETTTKGLAEIHHRMPVVLNPSQFSTWLSPKSTGKDVEAMIESSRIDFLAHRVSIKVNSTRNDSPELIREIQTDKL